MPDSSQTVPLDAIVEALFEIRFNSSVLSDLIVGRLSSLWPKATPVRLPTADIPLPVRQQDPGLRFMAVIELHNAKAGRVVKVGEQVISYHCTGAYPGWPAFRKELMEDFVGQVINNVGGFKATRLGLR